MENQHYDNSTLTLTSISTPDPFVTRAHGRFYMTFTTGNRIEVWSSQSLADIESASARHVIWTPPQGTDHSADLWAPELHALRGRWYIYYAAAHPAHGNKSHRMFVLGGPSAREDPCRGQWEFLGRIHDTPEQWAIDGTPFELRQQLYFAYSGWPLDNPGDSDLVQQIFILKLDDPTSAAGPPVAISRPEHRWEISHDGNGDHGINEGPQFLASPDGRCAGLVYSCAGSWTNEYKMAFLRLVGNDPMDPASWHKCAEPMCQAKGSGSGPFGPGHGSFVEINGEVVAVYHATDSPTDGWENRRARAQRVAFTENGPYMGKSFDSGSSNGHGHGLVTKIKAKLHKQSSDSKDGEESLRALLDGRRLSHASHGNTDGNDGFPRREL
ncbi:glycoside hydrolase family 43 protein [Xylariaceae sp. FL0804]|nr:glycoside hydrolase family 43 protein [Xylariaceae sp. FL0804]